MIQKMAALLSAFTQQCGATGSKSPITTQKIKNTSAKFYDMRQAALYTLSQKKH